ncbi:hypothetical protein Btru_014023 [Bulinus truncatus]|nr:hypothetical protein Btru_014023 [Bulinus truncatus]
MYNQIQILARSNITHHPPCLGIGCVMYNQIQILARSNITHHPPCLGIGCVMYNHIQILARSNITHHPPCLGIGCVMYNHIQILARSNITHHPPCLGIGCVMYNHIQILARSNITHHPPCLGIGCVMYNQIQILARSNITHHPPCLGIGCVMYNQIQILARSNITHHPPCLGIGCVMYNQIQILARSNITHHPPCLGIGCVMVEKVQGFCHSFDLNIGQATMRYLLKSDTVTLNLMKHDDSLDAARVVILTPEDVTQYRISVWGHHNTRFLLTVENMCSGSRQINGQDAPWTHNVTSTKDVSLNRTSSNRSSYIGHQIPEYSRPNNLPQLDPNTNQITKTKSTPPRIRGGIKHNSFRPSNPTEDSLQARRSTVLPGLSTLLARPQTLIYTPTGINNKQSDNKEGNVLTRSYMAPKGTVTAETNSAEKVTNSAEKVSNEHPEADKLEWMENKRVVFEKKMDYYQSLYQSNENISDYSDYVTEVTDGGSNPSTPSKTTEPLKMTSRESEASNDFLASQNYMDVKLSKKTPQITKNNTGNVSPVKLLYRVLNYGENNVSDSGMESKDNVQAVAETIASSYSPLETLVESLVTTKSNIEETSSTKVDVPLFLFNSFINNESGQITDHSNVSTVVPISASLDRIPYDLSPSSTVPKVPGGEVSTRNNIVVLSTSSEFLDYTSTVSPQSTIVTSILISSTGTSLLTSSLSTSTVTSSVPPSSVTSSASTSTVSSSGPTTIPTIPSTGAFLQTEGYQSTRQSQTAINSSTHPSTTLINTTPSLSTSTTTPFQPTISPTTTSQTLTKTLLPETASPNTISASNSTSSASPSTESITASGVTTESTSPSTYTTSSIGTTNPKAINIFNFTLPTFKDPASDSVQKSTTSGQPETSKDDETVWPVVIALVLGIPALVVVGIAVTVIHRRRRPNPQKVFGMKTLRACSTPRLSANSSTIRTTLRLSTASVEV